MGYNRNLLPVAFNMELVMNSKEMPVYCRFGPCIEQLIRRHCILIKRCMYTLKNMLSCTLYLKGHLKADVNTFDYNFVLKLQIINADWENGDFIDDNFLAI